MPSLSDPISFHDPKNESWNCLSLLSFIHSLLECLDASSICLKSLDSNLAWVCWWIPFHQNTLTYLIICRCCISSASWVHEFFFCLSKRLLVYPFAAISTSLQCLGSLGILRALDEVGSCLCIEPCHRLDCSNHWWSFDLLLTSYLCFRYP